MSTSRFTIRLLVLLVFAGTTIARAQQRDAKERHCEKAEWPKKLPAVGEVVDSALLATALAALPASDTGTFEFSILYRESLPPRVRLLQPQVPSSTVDAFGESITRGLKNLPNPRIAGALRLRVRAGATRETTVDRAIFCEPVQTSNDATSGSRTIRVNTNEGDVLPAGGRVRIDAELTLDETGHVTQVRVVRGSGLREFDEELVRRYYMRVYLPATLDGLAMPGWVRTSGQRMKM